jgi:nitroreductase/Pyruvate/2-oxoacid:ferredoxin oxidoreductase delta subunit
MHSLYRESGVVSVDAGSCTKCGTCVKTCPAEALAIDGTGVHTRADSALSCFACGHCMMVCPSDAITITGRGVSPDDLLPRPDPTEKASADALSALMRARRSTRSFDDREVNPKTLARIVEMAGMAPMSVPPWDVGCVTLGTRDAVRALAEKVVKGYKWLLKWLKPGTLGLMRPFVSKPNYELLAHFVLPLSQTYIRGHEAGRDMIFYDAPAAFVFHYSPYSDPADVVIACTYAMLAAESLGLGTTVIGSVKDILLYDKPLCAKLGIPAGNKPSLALIVGYPATEFRRTIRRTLVGAAS